MMSMPAPSVTPVAPTSAVPAGSGSAVQISILPGSGTYQPDNAADEFAPTESPADYSVNDLMVELGATVTWTNNDQAMPHTVTAVDGSFDSGQLSPGQTFSFTFDKPGEFEYYCTLHPWMRAKVEVMMH